MEWSMNLWNIGLGATGSVPGSLQPLGTSGTVWFVDSATGDDASTGTDEFKPLETLAQAVTNASDGDWIILAATHDETLGTAESTGVDVDKRVFICGVGSSSGIPSAKITVPSGLQYGIDFSVDGSILSNVHVLSGALTTANYALIRLSGDDCLIEDVVIDVYNTYCGLLVYQTTGSTVRRTTVRNIYDDTIVDAETYPPHGIVLNTSTRTTLDQVTVDAGAYGWRSHGLAATDVAETDIRIPELSLLRGSDAALHASSTGYYSLGTVTGQGRVTW
jgi:hypothetical protein